MNCRIFNSFYIVSGTQLWFGISKAHKQWRLRGSQLHRNRNFSTRSCSRELANAKDYGNDFVRWYNPVFHA